jgi:predicted SnoaL-like aldol condensation-catalyzing enzyme
MPVAQENAAAIEAFWQAWNEERLDDALEIYSPDARLCHLTHAIEVVGRDEIGELMKQALKLFPGRRSECVHAHAAGDVVITEMHWHGIAADSGQSRAVDICYIFRFVNGKVVEQREYG